MNQIFDFFSKLSFTSISFFAFVLLVFGVYYLVAPKYQNHILLLSSCLFCFGWGWKFSVIILFYSWLIFILAIQIEKTENPIRGHWLLLGITSSLMTLFFFKYFNDSQGFLIRVINYFTLSSFSGLISTHLLPPIGISFYVLQAISYLIDVHKKQIPSRRDFVSVFLYLVYFPKLLAGPIERAGAFFDQIHANKTINNSVLADNLLKILVGLVRKIVISDMITKVIPFDVFQAPKMFSPIDVSFWWIVYAFVIYNDFAGYTSIARGISGLFGIQLSSNFEQPFFSTSFIEFWNRWHISLSNWLRDYIYLPLSRALLRKNPNGKYWPNLVLPPIATMVVSGLWHGLNPHFLLWGILNGLLQGVERIQKARKKNTRTTQSKWTYYASIVITFLILFLINIPFKLGISQTFAFWASFFTWRIHHTLTIITLLKPILGIASSLLIDYLYLSVKDEEKLSSLPKYSQVALLSFSLFLLFLATRQQISTPFIYQEF